MRYSVFCALRRILEFLGSFLRKTGIFRHDVGKRCNRARTASLHRSRPLLLNILPTNYVQKLIFEERSRFYKDVQKLILRKIKKPPNPQGTEKLGDTTLINAYAFTHLTVNAGATPVISRNSEAGSIKGDVGISQPDRILNRPRRIPSLKTYCYLLFLIIVFSLYKRF